MTTRVNKYTATLQGAISVDDGTGALNNQVKYSNSIKVDYVKQISLDLLPNVETNIVLPNLSSIRYLQYESIDPVSLALLNDTGVIPAPIYNAPSVFCFLVFPSTLPYFAPAFVKVKSTFNTSIVISFAGNRI